MTSPGYPGQIIQPPPTQFSSPADVQYQPQIQQPVPAQFSPPTYAQQQPQQPTARDQVVKYLALVVGVGQLCMASMLTAIALVQARGFIPPLGIASSLGVILTCIGAAFGIQYSRSGNQCPAIASMVLSILAAVLMLSVIGLSSGLTDSYSHTRPDSHDYDYGTTMLRVWRATWGVQVFAGLINFICSIVQATLASILVCPCFNKTVNTNVYMTQVQA